ncbi:MAG: hypothetical protein ABF307_08010, partial [Candidatus Nanopelagicales bacterium]
VGTGRDHGQAFIKFGPNNTKEPCCYPRILKGTMLRMVADSEPLTSSLKTLSRQNQSVHALAKINLNGGSGEFLSEKPSIE